MIQWISSRKLSKRARKLIAKRSKLSREIQTIQLDVDIIQKQIQVCVDNIELLTTSNDNNSSSDHDGQLQHDCEFLKFLQTELAHKKVHLQKLVKESNKMRDMARAHTRKKSQNKRWLAFIKSSLEDNLANPRDMCSWMDRLRSSPSPKLKDIAKQMPILITKSQNNFTQVLDSATGEIVVGRDGVLKTWWNYFKKLGTSQQTIDRHIK